MVTSQDVARLAGVSQPTVSRALRDDPQVSEETKQRVREAARGAGLRPERDRSGAVQRPRRAGSACCSPIWRTSSIRTSSRRCTTSWSAWATS